MTTLLTGEEIRALVRPGRVHRRIYADPDIFDLELERIFGSAWIYVGHESQIKAPGDFLATRIGRKPLLLVRDAEGRIQLLHNQCAHRGSMVVASEAGHSPELRCCYHGWTYHLDGRLKAAPLLHGYPPSFRSEEPGVRDAARAAGGELSRLRLRQPGGGRSEPRGFSRLHDDVVRRHGRSRAGRRAGRRRRRVQAHATRATGSSTSKISATRRIRCSRINPRSTPRSSNPMTFIRMARARSQSGRCARTARPTASGRRMSASGPTRTATAFSATITTMPSSSPR